jgi:hypothetical protein
VAQHTGDCKEWSAIHDFMPPRPARLRVEGKCTFPGPGYVVTLSKKAPQGINPTILILDKKVTPPKKEASGAKTIEKAEYHEVTDVHYGQVQIEPDGTTIKVEEVH